MAETTFDSSPSGPVESSIIARNDDPLTLLLRSGEDIDIEQIISVHRAASPLPAVAPSSGTNTQTTGFTSSHKQSTKPTSAGTSYPVEYAGKAPAIATYASSLSATAGSASEADADVEASGALFGVGYWVPEGRAAAAAAAAPPPRPPPSPGCVRPRPRANARQLKKPAVVVHHGGDAAGASTDEDGPAVAKPGARCGPQDQVKYLRNRRSHRHDVTRARDEALHPHPSAPSSPKPLSRARLYTLVGLVAAIVLALALCAYFAHRTGKSQLSRTRAIISSVSVLECVLTVAAMSVSRFETHNAFLGGLLVLALGFALLVAVEGFM